MSSFICSSRTISQHNGHDRMSYPSAHAMWEPFPCMPAKNYRVPNYKLHETITIHSKTFTTWAQLTLTIIRHGIHNNKTVNASDFSIIENMKRNYFFHKGRLEIQSQFVLQRSALLELCSLERWTSVALLPKKQRWSEDLGEWRH